VIAWLDLLAVQSPFNRSDIPMQSDVVFAIRVVTFMLGDIGLPFLETAAWTRTILLSRFQFISMPKDLGLFMSVRVSHPFCAFCRMNH